MLKTDKKAKQIPKDVPTQKGAYIRLAKHYVVLKNKTCRKQFLFNFYKGLFGPLRDLLYFTKANLVNGSRSLYQRSVPFKILLTLPI
jgi:hypothetical protein